METAGKQDGTRGRACQKALARLALPIQAREQRLKGYSLIPTRGWAPAGQAAWQPRGLHMGKQAAMGSQVDASQRRREGKLQRCSALTAKPTRRKRGAAPNSASALCHVTQCLLHCMQRRALHVPCTVTHLRSARTWPGASRAARSPSSWWGAPCWPCCMVEVAYMCER